MLNFARFLKMKVAIVNLSNNPHPKHQTDESAGVDLMAYIDQPITIKPLERCLVSTGIYISLPLGTEAQIRPRSGLAYKHGITVLNSPGTIDSDYRGEIKVLLVNLSDKEFIINNGERIAQMIVSAYHTIEWESVTELSETNRGEGGYGSTGVK